MKELPIQRAVRVCKTQIALAEKITRPKHHVSSRQVSHWCTGVRPVPAVHCLAIERATGGKVTARELRPDVFDQGGEHEAA